MSDPLVSIGLVTWDSAVYLSGTIGALIRQSYRSTELTVVDNGSRDNSLEIVKHYCPEAATIQNATNTGFCQAHNQAIRASKGSYYLALNPDIEMEPDYILNLVHSLEQKRSCGTAVGKLLLLPGEGSIYRIDSAGLFIDRRRRQFLRGHGDIDRGASDTGHGAAAQGQRQHRHRHNLCHRHLHRIASLAQEDYRGVPSSAQRELAQNRAELQHRRRQHEAVPDGAVIRDPLHYIEDHPSRIDQAAAHQKPEIDLRQ